MELKYQVYINNQLSELATEKLMNFGIEDNSGLQLDSLDLSINNADDSITIPQTNAVIEIAIGYDGELFKMGKFVAQNINATSSVISIKAISQDLTKGRIKYNRVFKQKTLDDVLKTLASDLSLSLQLDNNLKTNQIAYYLQENKTSLEILAELSEIFYSIANIKDNKLVFVSKENTKSIEILEEDILSITKQDVNNKHYAGVIYNSWNIKEAKLESTKLGNETYLILQNSVDESIKNSYINSKYKEIQEKQYINVSLKQGNPNLQAGFSFTLKVAEQYSQFNGKYRIEKVTHKYNNTYVTSILAVNI